MLNACRCFCCFGMGLGLGMADVGAILSKRQPQRLCARLFQCFPRRHFILVSHRIFCVRFLIGANTFFSSPLRTASFHVRMSLVHSDE